MHKLDWQQIDTVLLDMDGTLLDLHFDNHFWQRHVQQRYAEKYDLTVEQATKKLKPHFIEMMGKLEWYCVDYWTTKLGLDIEGMKEEVAHLIAIKPFALEFLLTLRQHGKRTVMVTNAHHKSLAIKMRLTALQNHLDQLYCSHDFGIPKEQETFWRELQHHEPFNPERTLLIDDSLPVLRSAARYGIHYLCCIYQPDSKAPPKDTEEFFALRCYQDFLAEL